MSWRGWYALDLRALAVWRIALGLVVLWDIVLRARDLQAFYGDHGVLSRAMFVSQSWEWPGYHLFLATGSTPGLLLMFALWALAALCLTLGYRHRLAGLVTWYFVASIQLRNPLVMDGGDDLLRVLLFWTPFLPLSARWSVEAKKNPCWRELANSYASPATFAVLLQLFVLYLFAALLKSGDDWWKTGDALYYALSIDQFSTSLGATLAAYPNFLRPLSFAALALEFALALLVLLRGRLGWAQTAFFTLAVVFHLAIASLLNFGIFMYIAIAGLTVTVPTAWLDRLAPWPAQAPDAKAPAAPLPPGYRLALPTRLFCGFMIVMIAIFNAYSIDHVQKIPRWTIPISNLTFEQQHWHLFAPEPPKGDGWYALEVTLSDGKEVDAWNPDGQPGIKPARLSGTFGNQRWRRWMQNLMETSLPDYVEWRKSTLAFLAERWAQAHPGASVRSFRLVLWREINPPPGQPLEAPERIVLAQMPGFGLRQ